MRYVLFIAGRLSGLNDLISAERTNLYKGASLKRKQQKIVEQCIRQQFRNLHIRRKVVIHYEFAEANKRRDLDNISGFAHKVIQDALVSCGVLANDGWKEIAGYTDTFRVDKNDPHITVIIEEL